MKNYLTVGVALVALSTSAFAQDQKHFDGGFVGAEIGYLDAGDGFNGLYYGANGGYRVQTDSNLVYGLEGTFGTTEVDVFGINDVIDHQWSANATVGWAFGAEKRDLFSLGVGYANVKVSALGQSATGDGVAGLVSYERAIGNNLSFRVKATTYEFDTFIGTAGFALRF